LQSQVENPLDEQLLGPSEELDKNLAVGQDKIQNGQDFLPMNVNLIKSGRILTKLLDRKSPRKASTKVSKKKEIEEIATLNKGLQNLGENDDQN